MHEPFGMESVVIYYVSSTLYHHILSKGCKAVAGVATGYFVVQILVQQTLDWTHEPAGACQLGGLTILTTV